MPRRRDFCGRSCHVHVACCRCAQAAASRPAAARAGDGCRRRARAAGGRWRTKRRQRTRRQRAAAREAHVVRVRAWRTRAAPSRPPARRGGNCSARWCAACMMVERGGWVRTRGGESGAALCASGVQGCAPALAQACDPLGGRCTGAALAVAVRAVVRGGVARGGGAAAGPCGHDDGHAAGAGAGVPRCGGDTGCAARARSSAWVCALCCCCGCVCVPLPYLPASLPSRRAARLCGEAASWHETVRARCFSVS